MSPPAHTSAGGRGSEPLRCGDLLGPRAEQEVSQGREPEGSGLSFRRRPGLRGPPTGRRLGGVSLLLPSRAAALWMILRRDLAWPGTKSGPCTEATSAGTPWTRGWNVWRSYRPGARGLEHHL